MGLQEQTVPKDSGGSYSFRDNTRSVMPDVTRFESLLIFVYSLFLSDFHKSAPYVVSGSVDQTIKIWECR